MLKDFTISNLLDLNETIAGELFEGKTYPWEVLPEIGDFILKLGKTLDLQEYDCKDGNIWIAKSANGCTDSMYQWTGDHRKGRRSAPLCIYSAEMPS